MIEPSVWSAITTLGLPTVALVAVATMLYRVLMAQLADLRKQRDEAVGISRSQVDAMRELTALVKDALPRRTSR